MHFVCIVSLKWYLHIYFFLFSSTIFSSTLFSFSTFVCQERCTHSHNDTLMCARSNAKRGRQPSGKASFLKRASMLEGVTKHNGRMCSHDFITITANKLHRTRIFSIPFRYLRSFTMYLLWFHYLANFSPLAYASLTESWLQISYFDSQLFKKKSNQNKTVHVVTWIAYFCFSAFCMSQNEEKKLATWVEM